MTHCLEVCLHMIYLFVFKRDYKYLVNDVSAIVFLLALLSHESLPSLHEVVFKVFSLESTPLVMQLSLLTISCIQQGRWFKTVNFM